MLVYYLLTSKTDHFLVEKCNKEFLWLKLFLLKQSTSCYNVMTSWTADSQCTGRLSYLIMKYFLKWSPLFTLQFGFVAKSEISEMYTQSLILSQLPFLVWRAIYYWRLPSKPLIFPLWTILVPKTFNVKRKLYSSCIITLLPQAFSSQQSSNFIQISSDCLITKITSELS